MFLVTGATGNVGSQLVGQLLGAGHKVRAFTRDPARLAQWGDRIEIAAGDFGKPETFASALDGTDAVFLNTGPVAAAFEALVAALKARGSRVVFLSSALAGVTDVKLGQLHKEKEDAIRAAGLDGKFLRCTGFMTNSLRWVGTIKAEGVIYNPMGNGKLAPIAPEDIAAVAIRALTAQDLPGEIFEVTGGELLSVPEQVEILSQALGRPLRSVDISMDAAIQQMIRDGVPAPIAAGLGQSLERVRDGGLAQIKDTVRRLTGKAPKTFAAWAGENAKLFS
jgi:uncharacterized protein YbjT (DUF2867 family)